MVAVYVAIGVIVGLIAAAALAWFVAKRLGVAPADRAWIDGMKARTTTLVDKVEREIDATVEPDEPWRQ